MSEIPSAFAYVDPLIARLCEFANRHGIRSIERDLEGLLEVGLRLELAGQADAQLEKDLAYAVRQTEWDEDVQKRRVAYWPQVTPDQLEGNDNRPRVERPEPKMKKGSKARR